MSSDSLSNFSILRYRVIPRIAMITDPIRIIIIVSSITVDMYFE